MGTRISSPKRREMEKKRVLIVFGRVHSCVIIRVTRNGSPLLPGCVHVTCPLNNFFFRFYRLRNAGRTFTDGWGPFSDENTDSADCVIGPRSLSAGLPMFPNRSFEPPKRKKNEQKKKKRQTMIPRVTARTSDRHQRDELVNWFSSDCGFHGSINNQSTSFSIPSLSAQLSAKPTVAGLWLVMNGRTNQSGPVPISLAKKTGQA